MKFFLISNIKDFIEIAFWLFGWFFAWQGLSTWKKQIRWNIEYETARKILNLIYRLRHWAEIVRQPLMFAYEMNYTWDKAWLSEKDIKTAWLKEAYIKRQELLNETRQAILIDILEAEVLWWKEIKIKLYELLSIIRELDIALGDFFEIKWMSHLDEYWKDRSKEIREIIYSKSWLWVINQKDEFALKLEWKINDIENYLKKYLKF